MGSPVVVFGNKAYLGIVAETYEKIETETGGIFLGKKIGDTWYVLETLDPGPNSIFQAAYFEYDTPYVNHLANKIARFYKNGIELIGLWHRHPGNFSRFSATDDETNEKYARERGGDAISALVNLVPNFQLTVYRVDLPLRYTDVKYKVGNEYIPAELLQRKQISDYKMKHTSQLNIFSRYLAHITKQRSKGGKESFILKNISSNSSDSAISANVEVLDMIDSEIDYLTRQSDYEYSMKPQGEKILVSINYRYDMVEYPKQLNFIFGFSNKRGYVLVGNGRNSFEYHPNFIRDYINSYIKNYGVQG